MANYIGWDTETHLIKPNDKAPPLVCHQMAGGGETSSSLTAFLADEGWKAGKDFLLRSWYVGESGVEYGTAPTEDAVSGWALLVPARNASKAHTWALAQCIQHDCRMVAHNAPFDWGVMVRHVEGMLPFAVAAVEDKHRWSTDTKIREQLFCIATDNFKFDRRINKKRDSGGFSLAELVLIHFGEDITGDKVRLSKLIKEGVPTSQWPWRYRYEELEDTPLSQWPDEAVAYALEDAIQAYRVVHAQSGTLVLPEGSVCVDEVYVDEFAQCRADLALHLASINGVTVDADEVEAFVERVEAEAAKSHKIAEDNGWRKINKCKACAPGKRTNSGTGWYGNPPHLVRCMTCNADPNYLPPKSRKPMDDSQRGNCRARLEEWVTYAYGGCPPRTDPTEAMQAKGIYEGNIKTDADTLRFSGEAVLEKYAEGLAAEKLRNTYCKFLVQAAEVGTLHASYNVLVRSGRTSSFNPNQQNPPRVGGYRECFKAPEGMVFCSLDYAAQELATLAQVCLNLFGESQLAYAINEGLDPHLWFALRLLKTDGIDLTYEDAVYARKNSDHPAHKRVKHWRQVAKVCNFGYPGGLGANTFSEYAKGYGLSITPNESNEFRKAFFEQWPQVANYLNVHLAGLAQGVDRFAIRQHVSGRVRGGCTFTSAANTFFQGLAADGTKAALWDVTRAQLTEPNSPLYGTKVWNVIHDELLLVGPEETAHEWAYEAAHLMVEAMQRFTPQVMHSVEPALMRRWFKNADTVHENGRLTVWENNNA